MKSTSMPSTRASTDDDGFPHDLEKGDQGARDRPTFSGKAVTSAGDDLGRKWMSHLDDTVPVSALSIPGTHDSAAFTHPWPFVATQRMSILQQLDAGIRYFDLRCGVKDDVAEMVHGPHLLDLQLSEVLSTMYAWLKTNPSEGLIVQIKEDRKTERSTIHFSQAIFKCISADSACWRTANSTPLLGELRGKIQLFRRYTGPSLYAYGIDVTQWQDNPSKPFTIFTRNSVQLTIQDHYNFSDPTSLPSLIAIKGGDVSGLLDRASRDINPDHWYLNFTSAFEFNLYYQLPPREIAIGGYNFFRWEEGMNPRLREYLLEHEGIHRYGIVAMDFPDIGSEDLISTLIKTNFEPQEDLRRARTYFILVLVLLAMLMMAMLQPGLLGYATQILRSLQLPGISCS